MIFIYLCPETLIICLLRQEKRNKRQMKHRIISLIMPLMLLGAGASAQGLKDAARNRFLVGVCVEGNEIYERRPQAETLITRHFNSIVPGNCMKHQFIHPERDRYNWRDADQTVRYGKERGMAVIGHCLVWHSQVSPWMFVDETGKEVTRDTLIRRLHDHIHTVVSRYRGLVHGWDVINEAINDDGSLRETPYLRIIGPEYFEMAFRFAHEADPDVELYYNDYSMALPAKREAVCRLVRDLRAKGCRIDAVGMQSHLGLTYPDLADYEKSILALSDCGVNVMVTELDVSVLPNPWDFQGADVNQNFEYSERMNPYTAGLPDSVYQRLERRYMNLFDIYRRHADRITRVTFWGFDDGSSWLNGFPIHGRTNYPLLFDRQLQPKPVVEKIIRLLEDRKGRKKRR